MFNATIPITNISRIRPAISGFCYWYFMEWDSVTSWPIPDLQNGIIVDKVISQKPWRKLEIFGSMKYQDKDSTPGTYTLTELTGVFRATSPEIILKSYQVRSKQWVIVAKERNGTLWLIGDIISGAVMRSIYESNDTNRILTMSFSWESEAGPYIYQPLPNNDGNFSLTDFSIKDFF